MVFVGAECAFLGHHIYALAYGLEDVAFLVAAENEVDAFDGGYLPGVELCVAAGDDDEGAGMLAYELVDGLAAFAVGDFGDAAGVDDADVGNLVGAGGLDSFCLELLADCAGLGKVEFAAEGEVYCFFVFEVVHAFAKIRFFSLNIGVMGLQKGVLRAKKVYLLVGGGEMGVFLTFKIYVDFQRLTFSMQKSFNFLIKKAYKSEQDIGKLLYLCIANEKERFAELE